MAFKRKRGNSWYVYWTEPGPDGKRRQRAQRISRYKDIAEKRLREIEHNLDLQKHLGYSETQEIDFRAFTAKYLAFSHTSKRSSSYIRDRLSVSHLVAYFIGPLKHIRPERIEQYKSMRSQLVKPGTVNRELACLKHIFTKTVEWGYSRDNPVKKVKLFREPPGRVRYLSEEEIEALINACSPKLKPIVILAVNTGMRRGEIINLTWNHVKFREGFLFIPDSKTHASRAVSLNEAALDALQSLKATSHTPRVFGYYAKGCSIRSTFRTALKKADITDFRFQDLRHTCASHLAMKGWNMKTIQELLGHKSIEMTMRYAHLSQSHLNKAVGSLNFGMTHEPTPDDKRMTEPQHATIANAQYS